MKKWIFMLAIGLALQCQEAEENIPTLTTDLDGKYEGVVIRTTVNQWFTPVRISFDTSRHSVRLTNGHFYKRGCKGNFETNGDTIVFEGNGCDCWCDCDPTAFCIGDILLGKYVYQLREDSLLMVYPLYLGRKENWYLKRITD